MSDGTGSRLGLALLPALLAAATAFAQSTSPHGAHLGFGVGLVVPQDAWVGTLDPTLWVTGNVRIRLGDRLWLEPEVGYWQREPDRDLTLSKVVNLGANVGLSSRGNTLRVWAGAGLGLHLLIYRREIFVYEGGEEVLPAGSETFTNAVPRAQLLAGLDYSLSARTTLFAAGRLDTSFIPEDDDLARQWKLYGGLRWGL